MVSTQTTGRPTQASLWDAYLEADEGTGDVMTNTGQYKPKVDERTSAIDALELVIDKFHDGAEVSQFAFVTATQLELEDAMVVLDVSKVALRAPLGQHGHGYTGGVLSAKNGQDAAFGLTRNLAVQRLQGVADLLIGTL